MMARCFSIVFFLIQLRGGIAQTLTNQMPDSLPKNPIEKAGWQLIFSDEFDGDTLDWAKWWPQEGAHGDELQWYTRRRDNLFLKDGMLFIHAQKETVKDSFPYTSGVVFSSMNFGKGHFIEIRCKIPKGEGLWPAFWFWRGADSSYQELDVFEYWSYNTRRFCVTNHYWDNLRQKRASEYRWIRPRNRGGQRLDLSLDFHTYAVYWDDATILVLLNNRLVARFNKNIPGEPFPIILNLAIYSKKGQLYPKTPTQADFIIDYVRVYKKEKT
jgi:beta-glucanase (GH16 family)